MSNEREFGFKITLSKPITKMNYFELSNLETDIEQLESELSDLMKIFKHEIERRKQEK